MARKHTNNYGVKHDYIVYGMVKTAYIADLNAHTKLVYKTDACHRHYKEITMSQNGLLGLIVINLLSPVSWCKAKSY